MKKTKIIFLPGNGGDGNTSYGWFPYLKNELEKGDIKIIHIEGLPLVTNWKLVWLKGKKLSPVASAYLNYIRENKTSINDTLFSWINKY